MMQELQCAVLVKACHRSASREVLRSLIMRHRKITTIDFRKVAQPGAVAFGDVALADFGTTGQVRWTGIPVNIIVCHC